MSGTTITYQALAHFAIGIAEQLRSNGVQRGDRVAVCSPQVPETIAAHIGIFVNRCHGLPLDPEYPPDRLRQMMHDCVAHVLLATGDIAPRIPTGTAQLIILKLPFPRANHNIVTYPSPGIGLDATSHIFYTSGSQVRPKA